MSISSLTITNFRNLAEVQISPVLSGLNIFYGNNGSGKTSFLEAIYYLGLGRSFRSTYSHPLIKHSQEKFSVFAHLFQNDTASSIPLGVERDISGSARLRMAEQEGFSLAEIAMALPMRMIDAELHQFFDAGPAYRRKYLDWGLFYHFPQFLQVFRQYERVLKQRNLLLKERRSKKELDAWTEELIRYGNEINALRLHYVNELVPEIHTITADIFPIPTLALTYHSGWPEELDFAVALADTLLDEMRFGYTQCGPHRADFKVTISDVSADLILSRGQQKLLICAMILAQGRLLSKHVNKRLIYLVDDLPSELDFTSRERLLNALLQQKSQVFVTAIDKDAIHEVLGDNVDVPRKVFHVEHGQVQAMIELGVEEVL